MANTLIMESCIMTWEGGHMPPIHSPLGAFECGSIFYIYQSYVEAKSYQMSCINHNIKQDTDMIFYFGQNL